MHAYLTHGSPDLTTNSETTNPAFSLMILTFRLFENNISKQTRLVKLVLIVQKNCENFDSYIVSELVFGSGEQDIKERNLKMLFLKSSPAVIDISNYFLNRLCLMDVQSFVKNGKHFT